MDRIQLHNYSKGESDQWNSTAVELPGAYIYFSYYTPVAALIRGELYVRKNDWGPTTGKHLNWIDGGSDSAKAKRIDGEEFERLLESALDITFGKE